MMTKSKLMSRVRVSTMILTSDNSGCRRCQKRKKEQILNRFMRNKLYDK